MKMKIILLLVIIAALAVVESKRPRKKLKLRPAETDSTGQQTKDQEQRLQNLEDTNWPNQNRNAEDMNRFDRLETEHTKKLISKAKDDASPAIPDTKPHESLNPERRQEFTEEMLDKEALRIRGGKNETGDYVRFPYMAAIIIYDKTWCSGAIVHRSFVLTAAHCFNYIVLVAPPKYTFKEVRVRVGSNDAFSGGTLLKVTNIMRHPDFEHEPPPHADIAVVRLEKDLNYTAFIKPIRIYNGFREPFSQSFVHVTGYGAPSGDSSYEFPLQHKVLRSVRMKVTRKEYCNDAYDMVINVRITDDFFCTSLRNGTRDACLFDAGAPAVQNGILVGIMSFGPENCGVDDGPVVFIRAYYFSKFVRILIRTREIELENQFLDEIDQLDTTTHSSG